MASGTGTPISLSPSLGGVGGWNLQTYKEHVQYLIEDRFGRAASARWTDTQICRAINEAQRLTQEYLRQGDTVSRLQMSTEYGVGEYDLPADLMGMRITNLSAEYTDGNWTMLPRITLALARELFNMYGDKALTTGPPTQWAIDEVMRKLLLFPFPDTNGSNDLSIIYDAIPSQMHRCFMPGSTITAAVTNGSASIVLSAASTSVVAGDDFGVLRTTQADGSAVSGESPVLWYRITDVTDTAVTLATVFDEPTASAAQFITAQVSDLEKRNPGRLGYALAFLAAASLLVGSAPQQAEAFRAEGLTLVSSVTKDEQGIHLPGHRLGDRTTFLRAY